jgi:TonB family protein
MNTNGTCDRFEREGILRIERGLSLDAHFDACPTCEIARNKYETLLAALPSAQPDVNPAVGWQQRVLRAAADSEAARPGFSFSGWGKPFVWTALAGACALAVSTFVGAPPQAQFEVQAETHAAVPAPELAVEEPTKAVTGDEEETTAWPLPPPIAPRPAPKQAPAVVPAPTAPPRETNVAPVPAKPAADEPNSGSQTEAVLDADAQAPAATRKLQVTRPDKLYGLAIKYPPAAMKAKIQGETSVQCTIRSDGRNTDCRILKGLPYLDNAVIRAVEAARSEPIRVNGKAVDYSDHIWHITITLREIVDNRTSARGLPTLNWNP